MPPRDLPPQTAAAYLKHQGDKLFTVVFGQSQGLGGAKDVAVTELLVNPTVFVKNELTVSGQVRIDGYVNRDIPVRALRYVAGQDGSRRPRQKSGRSGTERSFR